MSASSNRLPVFPTRMALSTTKTRQKGAQTGHTLLKRKSDALTVRYRSIQTKLGETKQALEGALQKAHFSMLQLGMAVGNETGAWFVREAAMLGNKNASRGNSNSNEGIISPKSTNTAALVTHAATFQVNARLDNVSGVQLPVFEAMIMPGKSFELTALARGGTQVQKTKEAFVKTLQVLIDLASLQVNLFITLYHSYISLNRLQIESWIK